MKETAHNDQIIMRYLLNDLPAEDEARFEEAYLRDASLFEQVQVLEEELIEDYVKGNLSDYERRRFEQHYLASAPRLAKVEVARQLIHLCSVSSPVQATAHETIGGRLSSLHSYLRQLVKQPPALRFGVATALLLVLGAGLVFELSRMRGRLAAVGEERAALERRAEEAEQQLAHERERLSEERTQSGALRERLGGVESQLDRLKQERAQSQGASIAGNNGPGDAERLPAKRLRPLPLRDQTVLLALMPGIRDIEKLNRAVISDQTRFVELRLDLGRQQTTRLRLYRGVVKTVDGGREIWTQDGIKPKRSGSARYVLFRVPADLFRTAGGQDFTLILSGRVAEGDSDEELENCYFQVTSRF